MPAHLAPSMVQEISAYTMPTNNMRTMMVHFKGWVYFFLKGRFIKKVTGWLVTEPPLSSVTRTVKTWVPR